MFLQLCKQKRLLRRPKGEYNTEAWRRSVGRWQQETVGFEAGLQRIDCPVQFQERDENIGERVSGRQSFRARSCKRRSVRCLPHDGCG